MAVAFALRTSLHYPLASLQAKADSPICPPASAHVAAFFPSFKSCTGLSINWPGKLKFLLQAARPYVSCAASQSDTAGEESVTQSRRSVVQTGATLALLAVFERLAALAESEPSESSEAEASVSHEAASGAGTATAEPASKPKKFRVSTESWYRVRGEGFAILVPPNYDDIVEYDESGNSLYGERAKEKLFAARFASPDRKEVLSVIVRSGSQLKLSFFETQDITEFGSLEEAAQVFVPAGSKIVAAAARKPTDFRVARTYYLYEFLTKDDKRVVMSAAAAGGRVFVFGAMAPNSRWKEVENTMRSAAINFALR